MMPFQQKINMKDTAGSLQTLLNCTSFLKYSRNNKEHLTTYERASYSIYTERGSITIETALVLPFFLLFCFGFIYIIQIMTIQIQTQQAIYQTAKQMSVYAYAEELEEEQILLSAGSSAAVYYIEREIETLLKSVSISGPRDYDLSSYMGEDELIDIIVTYEIEIPCNIFRLPAVNIMQRARTKAWTGYNGSETGQDQEMVYITETGSVYHRSLDCTHIRLSIQQVGDTEALRNEYGAKYKACERCVKNGRPNASVYITSSGDRYHNSISCSGLKRRVMVIPLTQVGDKRPCTRCGGG